jgi:hypothetical protein
LSQDENTLSTVKTFDYLDGIVNQAILLEDLSVVIRNWKNGKCPEEQEKYWRLLSMYDLSEGSDQEEYIFWKCHSFMYTPTEINIVPSCLKVAIESLKDQGYV